MCLKRNVRIKAIPVYNLDRNLVGCTIFQEGRLVLNSEDDYSIYMKNVNLNRDGTIIGRYLGVTSKTLIDRYCKEIEYSFSDESGFTVDGRQKKTGRMVAIENIDSKKSIILIQ